MSFSDFGRNAMAATVLTKPATATATVATTTTKKKDDPHRRFSDPLSPSSSSQPQQPQQRPRRRDYGVYDEKRRRRRSTATSSKPDPCNSSNRRQSDGVAIITRRKNKEEGYGSSGSGNNNTTTNNNNDCIIHRGVRPRLKMHHLPFMDEIAFSPEDASLTTTSISSDYYDDDDGWSKDDGSYSIHLNQSQTQTQQTTIWPNNNMRYPKHYNNLPQQQQQQQKSSRRQLHYTQQQQQHQHKKKPSTKTLVSSQVALFQIMVAELDTKSKQQHAQTCSSPGAMFKSRILLQSAQEADRDLKLVIKKQLEEQNNMHNNNNGSSSSTTKAQRLAEASSKKLQRDYDRASAQLYSIIHETKRRQLADIRSLQKTSNDTKASDKKDPIEEEEDFFDRAMRERQQEIQTINTKMHTVQEIYNDLAYLIDTQQEQIDDIEDTNEDTKVETKAGLEQIQYGMWALCASTTTENNNNSGGAAKSGRGTNRNQQNKNVNNTTLLEIDNSKDDDTTFGIHHKHGTASRSTPTMKHVLSSTRPKMAVHEMLNFMLCQGGDGSFSSVSQQQQQVQQQDEQYRVNYHDTGPDILDGRKKKHPYPTIQQQQQQQQGEMEELRVPPPPSSPLLPVEEDIEYPDAMDFLFHRTSDENNDDDDDEILLNTTKRRISKNGNDTGGNDDHMSISSSLPFRSTASVTAGGSGDDLDGNGSLPTVAWKNMIPLSPSKLENLHYSANVVYERGQNIMGDMVEKVQDAMAKQSTSSIKLPVLIKVDTEALRNSISCTVPLPTEDQHLFVDVDNNNIIERTNSDSNISRNRNRNSEGDTVIDRNDDDDSSDEYHHRRHQKESSLRRQRRSKSSKSPTSSNRHHRRSKSQQHRDGSHSSSIRRKRDDNHRSQRRSASSIPSSSSSSRRRRS